MVSLGTLVMGLIMPKVVMSWSNNKSRDRVALIFGSATLVFFWILFYTKVSMPYNTPLQLR
jgi:Ni/Fe-hydrogenase subunit HybB-like protein